MEERKEHIERNVLPTVQDAENVERKTTKTTKKSKKTTKTTSSKRTLKIEAPKGEAVKGGYNSRSLFGYTIPEDTADMLKETAAGLVKQKARLSNGTLVTTKDHAAIWILENAK